MADEVIDPEFGTGILKITPAHDKVDFEIGQRHGLPVMDVLHPNGRINCPALPELDGMERFEARKRAGELLAEQGLLGEGGAVREHGGLQRTRGRADRAALKRAMVSALSENRGSARRGARASHPLFSRALGEGLRAVAGEHSGLVHQPAGLVGPSDSGLVPGRLRRGASLPACEILTLKRASGTLALRSSDSIPGGTCASDAAIFRIWSRTVRPTS